MKLEAFDALIARLERQAEANPGWYATKVMCVAVLGFIAVAIILIVGIALAGGAIALFWLGREHVHAGLVKVTFAVGIFGLMIIWSVVSSLWQRLLPPVGVRVGPDLAPGLVEEVESIRSQIGAPRVHHVVVDGQLNAAMAQVPVLGIFGWQRNYLVLGLPLMRTLTRPELQSVIAHELGHLVGGHNRFSAWIYRLRATWGRLYASFSAKGSGKVSGWFLRWYAPWFNAYSFVLARLQEREADAAAVRVAGIEPSGRALRRVAVLARQAEDQFWTPFSRRPLTEPEAPAGYLDDFRRALASGTKDADRWHREALATPTDRSDTHPCLRERLEALGLANVPTSAPLSGGSATAKELLGSDESEIARRIDEAWRLEVAEPWRQSHGVKQNQEKRRTELVAKADPTADERWELARLSGDLHGDLAARPLLAAFVTDQPAHAQAQYLYGRIMLDADDAAGVAHIERAMELDGDAVIPGAELLRAWHRRHGKADIAQALERRAEQRGEIEIKAAAERYTLPKAKQLGPPTLGERDLAHVREVCAGFAEIGDVHIAAVKVQHLPEKPHHLVAFTIKVSWWKMRSDEKNQQLAQALAAALHVTGTCFVILAAGQYAGLAKKVRKIAKEPVYRHAKT